jgi:hypothetical protein
MKAHDWTVALTAAGLISQGTGLKAEEKVNSVLTVLSSTTLSGYVDTSAQWNFGTGNANLPPYRFGGPSKADGFNLDVVQLRIEKPLDETEWAAGYRVDLWVGPDANTLATQSFFGNGGVANPNDFAIRQAYVSLRLPIYNGIDWKLGVFDSIIGYETVESLSDPNYTRSYGHTLEPQTHTGVLAAYRFNDSINASVGIANTLGPTINGRAFPPFNSMAESYKSYMGSVALTAPASWGFFSGSTLYVGAVNGFDQKYAASASSYYVGATLATPVNGLRFGVAWDCLDVGPLSGENWSVAGYVSYQATQKLSFHGRAEYLKDRGAAKFFVDAFGNPTSPDEVLDLTLTIQYDLWKNVLSRLELRWDHSLTGQEIYGGTMPNTEAGGTGDLKNAWMLAANIIYRF